MNVQITCPRVNANADVLRLVSINFEHGAKISANQLLMQLESDKTVYDLVSPQAGYAYLRISPDLEEVSCGSLLVEVSSEPVHELQNRSDAPVKNSASIAPTYKAQQLLKENGIDAASVPFSGNRLGEADVLAFLQKRGPQASAVKTPPVPAHGLQGRPLTAFEDAMRRTVAWQQTEAVPSYLEISFPAGPWDAYAEEFKLRHQLLSSPIIALMAHQLALVVARHPQANSYMEGGRVYDRTEVNLGLTITAAERLYLAVIPASETMKPEAFCSRLAQLHRQAVRHKLSASDMPPPSVGFSSLAGHHVLRHIPILAPRTCLMVAHSRFDDQMIVGATYDHRLLHGTGVAAMLNELRKPIQD